MTAVSHSSSEPHAAGVRAAVGRVGWVVGDQALSSLTNFTLTLLVARTVTVADFGAFSIVTATYWLALGLARALTTEAFVVRYPHAEPDEWRRGVARASGASLVVGTLVGSVCVVAGALLGGTLGTALLVMGPFLPGLLLQDCWRFVFFARRDGASAFVNDLVWAIVLLPAIAMVLTLADGSVGWLIFAWGLAGTVGGVLGLAQSRVIPHVHETLAWWREQRDLVPPFLGDFAARAVSGQLLTYGLSAIVGLAGVGGLRAAEVLLGPLNILFLANGLAGVAEGVRLLRRSTRLFKLAYAALSAFTTASVLAWGGALLVMPSAIGTQVLGSSWENARLLLVPVILTSAAAASGTGPTTGLRALGAARRSLRTRLTLSVCFLGATLAAAAIGGVLAAAWTMAVSGAFASVVWWRQFLVELREQGDSARERR